MTLPKVHLRLATEADVVGPVMSAAEELATKFESLPFDEEDTLANFFLVIDQPDQKECMMVVAEDEEGKFRGVIAGVLVKIPYSDKSIANEMLFWTDGTPSVFKALHKAYVSWAEGLGVTKMFISAPADRPEDRWQQFYKTLGYTPCEYRYVREVV